MAIKLGMSSFIIAFEVNSWHHITTFVISSRLTTASLPPPEK